MGISRLLLASFLFAPLSPLALRQSDDAPDVRARVVATAAKYLYVRESNNRSLEVDRWNSAVRAPLGSPWCATFVSGILTEAEATWPRTRTAWARGFLDRRTSKTANAVLTGVYAPRGGDIVIWTRRTRTGTAGHIGFVETWRGRSGQTIEGNTSSGAAGSQWNGNGVYRRNRAVQPYSAFRIIGFTEVK